MAGESPGNSGAPSTPGPWRLAGPWPVLAVFAVAAAVRLYALDRVPPLNQDEAVFGYNALSIARTGRDMWGVPLPVSFQAFGDYSMPLYIYLDALPVALLGASEFSIRLVSALGGALLAVAVFLLAKRVTGDGRAGLAAGLLLALSPWPVHHERLAFGASLSPLFVAAGALLLLRGIETKGFLSLAAGAALAGLALYTYWIPWLFVPLLIAAMLAIFRREVRALGWKRLAVPAALLLLVGAPLAFEVFGHPDRNVRFSLVSVFSGAPETNRAATVLGNYLSFHHPDFLFFRGDSLFSHSPVGPGGGGYGVLPAWSLPFFLAGVAWLITHFRRPGAMLMLAWLLLYPVPASLTLPSPGALRSTVGLPALYLTAGIGAVALPAFLRSVLGAGRPARAAALVAVAAVALPVAAEVAAFDAYYFSPGAGGFAAKVGGGWALPYGWGEVVESVRGLENGYDAVVVSHNYFGIQDFVYPALYLPYPPADFVKDSDVRRVGPWVDVVRLGKFHFCELGRCLDGIPGKKLVVAKAGDPVPGRLLRAVELPGGERVFALYEA